MQKTGIIVLGSVAAMLPALAQASETVRLAEPDLAMEGSLMTALKNRHSTREYAAKDLTSVITRRWRMMETNRLEWYLPARS